MLFFSDFEKKDVQQEYACFWIAINIKILEKFNIFSLNGNNVSELLSFITHKISEFVPGLV